MKKEKQPSAVKAARKSIHERLVKEFKAITGQLKEEGINSVIDIEKEAKKVAKKITKGAKTDHPAEKGTAKVKAAAPVEVKTPAKETKPAKQKVAAKQPEAKPVDAAATPQPAAAKPAAVVKPAVAKKPAQPKAVK